MTFSGSVGRQLDRSVGVTDGGGLLSGSISSGEGEGVVMSTDGCGVPPSLRAFESTHVGQRRVSVKQKKQRTGVESIAGKDLPAADENIIYPCHSVLREKVKLMSNTGALYCCNAS